MINGIINVYKEAGYTSHDVVGKLRGIVRQKKIGHTGTLDPDAEGVLPVCLGNATKLCDLLAERDKVYETVFVLGVMTDTQDLSGQVLERRDVTVTPREVMETVQSFAGSYSQIPPMYSAKKVNGKKLYELAREGKVVERKPCLVEIHSITVNEISLPEVTMEVHCSKGTYIRTLCHDIGQKLGCLASMKSLKRTKSGIFGLQDSVTLAEIEALAKEGKLGQICIPVDKILENYPKMTVSQGFEKFLLNGNALRPDCLQDIPAEALRAQRIRIYDPAGVFTAVYRYDEEDERFVPVKMFLPEV